jgi:hypothetical protein
LHTRELAERLYPETRQEPNSSCGSSSRFGPTSSFNWVKPVMWHDEESSGSTGLPGLYPRNLFAASTRKYKSSAAKNRLKTVSNIRHLEQKVRPQEDQEQPIPPLEAIRN